MRVFVRNAAGLEGSLDSPPITVAAPADGMSPGVVVAIVCACMVGAAAVAGVTAYWLSRTRYALSAPSQCRGVSLLVLSLCYRAATPALLVFIPDPNYSSSCSLLVWEQATREERVLP